MLQRLVLYATLGYVLDLSGSDYTTWQFWCVLALFLANSWMTRRETLEEIEAEVERIKEERRSKHND